MNQKSIQKNELISDINSGLSKKQLLQKYKCSSGTLLSHIRKHLPDFTFKKNSSNILTKHFLETTDLTTTEICKIYDITPSTFFKYLQKYNIKYTKNKKAILKLENKEWLYNEYITKNKTLTTISEDLNCGRETIKKYLKLHHIKLKPRYKERLSSEAKALKDYDVIKLYIDKKLSIEYIASKYDCNSEYIRKILLKNNIEIRNGSATSSHEYFIQELLENLNIKFIPNTKKIISPYELDIFIPTKNLAIEINGIYYHSDKFIDANYHENKRILCESKNIKLIQLFEDDILNKPQIIKNFIASLFNENISIKKCNIIENVNINHRKHFMNSHHIDGYCSCNYSIGLTYKDEMIALMLFNNNTLIRYATSKNIPEIFPTLIQNCKFNNIKTTIDLNTFSAYPYFKCGFIVDKYIKPDYKFVFRNKRISKFSIKSLLKKSKCSISNSNLLNKVYDSGKLKLIWQR